MVSPLVFTESIQLPSGPAVMYTSPGKVTSIVKKCTVANTDVTNGHTFTIYLVPVGGGASTANILIYSRSIGPKQTIDVTEMVNQMLAGGDFIAAEADAPAEVNFRVSGVQIA